MLKFLIILISGSILPSHSIFVGPNQHGCPTNKIAPENRIVVEPKTLGYFYELFIDDVAIRPVRPQSEINCDDNNDDDNDEEQNEDESEDDKKVATPNQSGRNRFFNNWFGFNGVKPTTVAGGAPARPPTSPRPPARPPHPARPPTRPPYHSGGPLVNRPHVPPRPEYPSNFVKPVYEHTNEQTPVTWRPGVVGAPSGHIVGSRPTAKPRQNLPILRSFADLFVK